MYVKVAGTMLPAASELIYDLLRFVDLFSQ